GQCRPGCWRVRRPRVGALRERERSLTIPRGGARAVRACAPGAGARTSAQGRAPGGAVAGAPAGAGRRRRLAGLRVALPGPLVRRRVPVVLQLNQVECGAASLAMILGFHGRRTGVAECRAACGAGRSGATAATLLRAARAYGLQARGYAVEPRDCA